MLIDTHSHVNFKAFEGEEENVIRRAHETGVLVINVGTQLDTSLQALELAKKFSSNNFQFSTYAVVGLHPVHTYSQHLDEEETSFKTREENFDYEAYKKLAQNPFVVGIGECGLDYYRLPGNSEDEKVKKLQANAFIEQIKLAKELNKALVIHSRSSKGTDDACLDILKILKQFLSNHSERSEESLKFSQKGILPPQQVRGLDGSTLPRFVLHSYTGSPEVAKMFVDLGGYISFNGIITFDKTGNMEKVIKTVPLNRIVLETDSPYLTPVPHRGKKNEPGFVRFVAEHLARVLGVSVDEVAEVTSRNAKSLFQISGISVGIDVS